MGYYLTCFLPQTTCEKNQLVQCGTVRLYLRTFSLCGGFAGLCTVMAEEVDPRQDDSIAKSPPEEPLGSIEPIKTAILQDEEKHLENSQQRMDYIAGTQSLLTVVILGLACVVAFSSRLFAVIRFESIIHEFDPWYVNPLLIGH